MGRICHRRKVRLFCAERGEEEDLYQGIRRLEERLALRSCHHWGMKCVQVKGTASHYRLVMVRWRLYHVPPCPFMLGDFSTVSRVRFSDMTSVCDLPRSSDTTSYNVPGSDGSDSGSFQLSPTSTFTYLTVLTQPLQVYTAHAQPTTVTHALVIVAVTQTSAGACVSWMVDCRWVCIRCIQLASTRGRRSTSSIIAIVTVKPRHSRQSFSGIFSVWKWGAGGLFLHVSV